ncbi:hypothetical protein [Nocardioides sp.]|uniref:hypothetical protein n=1 Tax=Nocardioides sp. TaxID=35761 RepID=UPI002733468E|nr:hypothetical protein [Nocardioides sp.]MDP3891381.1 hypothetical protein [Nocardioides sp.]
MDEPGVRRAWGWVDHLRAGGTTPWLAWDTAGPGSGRLLPGAQQLELLRRINLAGRPSSALADEILAASAPGRGRPDLQLVGVAPGSGFGPPPVDPASLPDEELLRVATSVLADHLVVAGLPSVGSGHRTRLLRRRYRVVGDPVLADPVRRELVRRGRPPGGSNPVVLVMATGLETMVGHAFRSRIRDSGVPPWHDWVALLRARDHVPPRVDVLAVAHTWAERVGPGRIRVVLDPAAVPRLVGCRSALPSAAPIDADALELARQVAGVLGVLVRPEHRTALVDHVLLPRLAAAAPGPGPEVPAEHRDWLEGHARRIRSGIAAAGYAVHGDLETLLEPVPAVGDTSADGGRVLDLAVRQLLDDAVAAPVEGGR